MITLEEAVIGIPIGKAAGIGIPFIAEDVDVLLVHFDRRCETSNGKRFFSSTTMYLGLRNARWMCVAGVNRPFWTMQQVG